MAMMFFAVVAAAAALSFYLAVLVTVAGAAFGIVLKSAGDIGFDRFLDAALSAGNESDARIGQNFLGSRSDASADQQVHAVSFEETAQSFVTAAFRVDLFVRSDLAVLYVVDLEPACVSKMPKYLSVIVRYSNFHILCLAFCRFVAKRFKF